MRDNDRELLNCNFSKTILMLIIILYHSCVFWRGDWFTKNPAIESRFLYWVSVFLSHFHNYGFVIISGYVFFYLHFEVNRYASFWLFIKKKCMRLLMPYFSVLIFWVIPFAIALMKYDFSTVMSNYILGRAPNQLWFLLMLFWTYVISYYLSEVWNRNNVIVGLATSLFLYGFGFAAERIIPNCFQVWSATKYIIYFCLGFYLRKNSKQTKLLIQHAELFAILYFVLFAFLRTVESYTNGKGTFYRIGYEIYLLILNSLGGVMIFLILQKFASAFTWDKASLIKKLEPFSLQMYLFHQQIIWLFILALNGIVHPLINVLINFYFACLIAYFMSLLFSKNKVLSKMMGH